MMYSGKIGVMEDSFRSDIIEGIKKASELKANGVHIYVASDEWS